jgi:hypothetical protein
VVADAGTALATGAVDVDAEPGAVVTTAADAAAGAGGADFGLSTWTTPAITKRQARPAPRTMLILVQFRRRGGCQFP